jgi:hypothetical protein
MKITIPWKALAVTLLLAVPALPALSQYRQYNSEPDTLRSYLRNEMGKQMGRLVVKFWEPRLNVYKVRIDDIFSGRDLTQLNELRVRFAIIMEKIQKEEEERRNKYREESTGYGTTTTTATTTATTDTTRISDDVEVSADTALVEVAVNKEETRVDPAEEARRQEAREKEREAEEERKMDAREDALARGEDLQPSDDAYGYGTYRELERLPVISKWMANNYRSQLDNLADVVLADLGVFADTLTNFVDRYVASHAADLARVPELRHDLEAKADVKELRRMLRHPRSFKAMYSDRTEPFVLLYNGEGLSKLLGSTLGGESESSMTSHLPDNSMLQQNSPNPASKSTRITSPLPDASSQTAVRIFYTHGEVVMELNEGAKEAGEHQVTLDLSSLPSGSYVYQIAAHFPAGEQVSAKVMQVAK